MNPTLQQYDAADRPLAAILAEVPAERWGAPSPCEEWSARDVVRHLVDTQRELLTTHGVDLGEPPDVETDPASAWQEHTRRVRQALSDDAVPATAFEGYFGPTTVGATMAQFYVWDMLVHRWDVAQAVGGDAGLSEAELDRIEQGAEGFGETIYLDGICKPGVEAPPDAPREVRVLARLGRAQGSGDRRWG